jgi:hypothetical protein
MNTTVPSYLISYLLGGTFAVTITLLFGLDRALRLAHWPAGERQPAVWSIGVLVLAWLGAALLLSWSGFYQGAAHRLPTIPFGLLIPIVIGLGLFWPEGMLKRALRAVPLEWVVGVQVYRVLGLIFLVLYAGKHLPKEFAWPAGLGDVVVGLLAPAVALAYARGSRRAAAYVRAWNLLGLVDLVVALTTGVLTSPSPLQRLAFDAPNELISAFPLALVPVFLVPLSILLHLAALNKLQQTEPAPQSSRSPLAASGGH